MNRTVRFALLWLLLPVFFAAEYLESKQAFSAPGHTIAQVMIILVIYWLMWLWARFDDACSLNEYFATKRKPIIYRIYQTHPEQASASVTPPPASPDRIAYPVTASRSEETAENPLAWQKIAGHPQPVAREETNRSRSR